MMKRIFTLTLLLLFSCGQPQYKLNGYIEGQFTLMSSLYTGQLTQLFVLRGNAVKQGQKLFVLQAMPEAADVKSALALMEQAQSNLLDLEKGKRPSEIEAIQAQIDQTQAKIVFLSKDLQRFQTLTKLNYIEKQRYDQSVQDLKVAQANLKEFRANLTTAKIPSRIDQIEAARRQLQSTAANLEKIKWQLSEKTVNSPVDALVFDTLYRVGEEVPAQRPVVSLLAPRDLRVLFYVPEELLGSVRLGQKIEVSCDNCETENATITFISPSAEFTPPVIYSQSARSKLVYRVEAHFKAPDLKKHHPGQPVDIVIRT